MTSPYLDKPQRRLEQALQDRGLTRVDIGLAPLSESVWTGRHAKRRRPILGPRVSMAVAGVAAAAVLTLFAMGLDRGIDYPSGETPVAGDAAERLNDIAPAAGPASAPDAGTSLAPPDSSNDADGSAEAPAPTLPDG